MYKEYYGLSADPFRLAADHRNLYSHRSLGKARSYLQYGMQMSDGIILVTGASGTGKSTLINEVATSDSGIRLDPVVIECTDYTGTELLRHYAEILSSGEVKPEIPEALNFITQALIESKAEGRKPILILDEAHELSDDALRKLVLLANLQRGGESLVQLFLIGLPQLRDTILRTEYEHLHQRLVATCKIETLTAVETKEYILQNLSAVDWTGTPEICPNVFKAIHQASMGTPRWINLICSRLMLHGMTNDRQKLGLPDVCEVLRDLLNEDLLPDKVRKSNLKSSKLKAA